MKHYAIDQWTDFTRGQIAHESHTQMQAHLDGGCEKCRALWGFTAKLTVTCTSLAADVVPEPVVRLARAIFPVRMHDRPKRGNRLPIELIWVRLLWNDG